MALTTPDQIYGKTSEGQARFQHQEQEARARARQQLRRRHQDNSDRRRVGECALIAAKQVYVGRSRVLVGGHFSVGRTHERTKFHWPPQRRQFQ